MKKAFIILLTLSIGLSGFSQKRAIVPEYLKNYAVEKHSPILDVNRFVKKSNPILKSFGFDPEEEQIGDTRYDNQSNASIQNRIYLYEDGTIGAIWNYGMDEGSMFDDKGTGYNYFDGASWFNWPDTRVEDERTSRPSYAPWGENGEIIVSHTSGNGLYIATRDEIGTGNWDYESFSGPPGQAYILWNRTITSGTDNNRVHILSVTLPTTHGGTPYEGLDGALLYSLSTDGGNTWEMENEILDGMSSDDYYGFSADNYTWSEPKGDIVAFVVGETWFDLFLMKSTDGGETFEKTIIWEHPYPFWQYGTVADTFYCADGAHSIVIDDNDLVHVVFGINRAYADDQGSYWFPFVDGIAYWNENMPTFSNNLNALSPDGHPDSELIEDYNLIGWSQDVNNNGQLDFIGEIGNYYIGLSSMPQLVLDESNRLFLVYSSVTENCDNGTKNYRRLWGRASPDGGITWLDFMDLTTGVIHIFDECVYPSCPANSDENIYLIYQADVEPGTAIWGSQHPYVDNRIVFMKIPKNDFIPLGINEEKQTIFEYDVSQNYPNPFNKTSVIEVNLRNPADLSLEVINLMGQKVYKTTPINSKPGLNTLTVKATGLTPGVYFYTVKANESSVTKKMIVE